MTKRETLTESMRRYSNIVTEAEQLNELNWLRPLLRMLRGGSRAGPQGKIGGRVSTRHQLSDIDDLAKHFEREFGENPNKWHQVADLYFDRFKSDELANMSRSGPSSQFRPQKTIETWEKSFGNLIDAAAKVKRDPNDINLNEVSKLGKEVLSQLKKMPVGNDSRQYLDKLATELLRARADVTDARWTVGILSGIMAFYVFFFANLDLWFGKKVDGRNLWTDYKTSKKILNRGGNVPFPELRPDPEN